MVQDRDGLVFILDGDDVALFHVDAGVVRGSLFPFYDIANGRVCESGGGPSPDSSANSATHDESNLAIEYNDRQTHQWSWDVDRGSHAAQNSYMHLSPVAPSI